MMSPKRSSRKPPLRLPPEENGVVQLKVWLLGISPMIWRRLLVSSTCTLRELHGILLPLPRRLIPGSIGAAIER